MESEPTEPQSNGPITAAEMASAAQGFLQCLNPGQRRKVIYSLSDSERRNWSYVPRPRAGLPIKEMSSDQRIMARALLARGLSRHGLAKADHIISLEPILREIEENKGRPSRRDPELYFFTLFGNPGHSDPWGWRFEGHHISLNYTALHGATASTPTFFGANPAEVKHGPRAGFRALPGEEELARMFMKSLDDSGREMALISESAPRDIISGSSRRARPIEPAGLEVGSLREQQIDLLVRLLEEYASNMPPDLSTARMRKIREAGLGRISFAWAGGLERGQPHYYKVQGPTFLVEYDNIQNNANHIHSVWRDFAGDFGRDLLAEHYHAAHRTE